MSVRFRSMVRCLGLFLLAFIGVGLGGCMTLHSPNKLTPEQRAVVAGAGLSRLTVGLVAGELVSRERLEAWRLRIERTGLFKKVEIFDSCAEPPDLRIRIVNTAHFYSGRHQYPAACCGLDVGAALCRDFDHREQARSHLRTIAA